MDFDSDARRVSERGRSILKYVTDDRVSSNTAAGGKDKQEMR